MKMKPSMEKNNAGTRMERAFGTSDDGRAKVHVSPSLFVAYFEVLVDLQ